MTERELTAAVIEAARLLGWKVAHFRPGRTTRGWRTPVEGDGTGFPDLVLARQGQLLFAELKAKGGRLRPEQAAWIEVLGRTGAAGVHVWRPEDWESGAVVGVLRPMRVSA